MPRRRAGERRGRRRLWEDAEVDVLASRIDEHLVRMERAPKLNPVVEMIYGLQPKFDDASAKPLDEAPLIGVRYWGWGPRYLLDKPTAKRYLKRLDAGFAGRHDE